jgi:hypothetical protein
MKAGACMLFIILLFSSCYYDSVEYLFPNVTACDTTNVTFSGSVQPILQDHCYGCHSNTTASGSATFALEDIGDVVAHVDRLVGAISHQSGFSPIPSPLGTPKIDDCSIRVIGIWVTAGTPDN